MQKSGWFILKGTDRKPASVRVRESVAQVVPPLKTLAGLNAAAAARGNRRRDDQSIVWPTIFVFPAQSLSKK